MRVSGEEVWGKVLGFEARCAVLTPRKATQRAGAMNAGARKPLFLVQVSSFPKKPLDGRGFKACPE